MSYLHTIKGTAFLKTYLKPFNEGSRRVYRSEIQQFFDFRDLSLVDVTADILQAYRQETEGKHTAKTTKRKFSILNGFFKFLETRERGFKNPITSLKDFRTRAGDQSEEVKRYLDPFLIEQHTENTKRSYRNLITLFFRWANRGLQEIGNQDMLRYRDALREEGYKDSTIWNRFVALNRFFKYVERENRRFHNPIVFRELRLVFPKRDRGYYSVVGIQDAKRLLSQPDRKSDMGKRDRSILFLMLVYGLRANEITRLTYGNLEPERVKGQQKAWITDRKGKYQNRPETAIILNGKALQAFDAWTEAVKRAGINTYNDTPIFLPFIYNKGDRGYSIRRDRLNEGLSVKAVENIVERHIKKAKIQREGKTLSAHALRHTAFTMLAHAGLPIQEIQKLAGHQDINTTMIYIHAAQSYDDHPGMHSPLNLE